MFSNRVECFLLLHLSLCVYVCVYAFVLSTYEYLLVFRMGLALNESILSVYVSVLNFIENGLRIKI